MSNFLKRTKHAWEENEYDENHKPKYEYPLSVEECYPKQALAMFDPAKLSEAFEYYIHKTKGLYSPENLFTYLYKLEKDVPLESQRYQP